MMYIIHILFIYCISTRMYICISIYELYRGSRARAMSPSRRLARRAEARDETAPPRRGATGRPPRGVACPPQRRALTSRESWERMARTGRAYARLYMHRWIRRCPHMPTPSSDGALLPLPRGRARVECTRDGATGGWVGAPLDRDGGGEEGEALVVVRIDDHVEVHLRRGPAQRARPRADLCAARISAPATRRWRRTWRRPP